MVGTEKRLSSRTLGGTGWNVWRGVVGGFYLAAAVFNLVYTLPRHDELDGYAEGAWFTFLEDFMWDVFMPNAVLFMLFVILVEAVVGVLILSSGAYVDVGVGASLVWVLVVLPFLAFPYLLVNVALMALQGVVLFRRYDTPVWDLVFRSSDSPTPHPS